MTTIKNPQLGGEKYEFTINGQKSNLTKEYRFCPECEYCVGEFGLQFEDKTPVLVKGTTWDDFKAQSEWEAHCTKHNKDLFIDYNSDHDSEYYDTPLSPERCDECEYIGE